MTVDDGPSLKQTNAPPRQLDAALPPGRLVGTVAVWSEPLSEEREELDEITTDKDMIAWDKSARRVRSGTH